MHANYLAHLERFAKGQPIAAMQPHQVWINQPKLPPESESLVNLTWQGIKRAAFYVKIKIEVWEDHVGIVVFNMSMSLDGFVAGPNDGPDNGLGDGGDKLFKWYFRGNTEISVGSGSPVLKVSPQSAKILKEAIGRQGAGVWGRRTFDIARGWGGHPPISPSFIVTHTVPKEWVKEGSPFTFVTDGVENAIRQAKKAAGDKDVVVCTASILQQCLKARLIDEIYVDVAPVLLGGGVRLFDHLGKEPVELETIRAIEAPGVTHLGFRVVK